MATLQVRNDDNIMAPNIHAPGPIDLFPEPPIKIREEDLFAHPPTKIVEPAPTVSYYRPFQARYELS